MSSAESTRGIEPASTRPPALRLWVALSRAYLAIRGQAEADVARHGLTLTEFGILEAVYHRGPMRLCDIQGRLLVSSGGVTYLVDRLQAEGLVRRREALEDRRARYVELTPEGRALIERIFPEHERRLTEVLDRLTETEQRHTAELLKTLGVAALER